MSLKELNIFKRKVFFGWWTVLATGVMYFWGYGVWSYGFGVYFQPMAEEFGWSRAQISGAAALRRLEGGAEGPFGGFLTDKYGPRAVNLTGIIMASLGFFLMYFINSYLGYLLVWGFVVSLGFNLGMIGPLDAAIANWFVKKRGLAGSISRAFLGFGGGTIPAFMTLLLIWYGWRTAFVIAGLITLAIGVPLTWFFVRPNRPEYYGLLPDGAPLEEGVGENGESVIQAGQRYAAELEEVEFTVRESMRTRAFWIEILSGILLSLVWPCVTTHQIPHLIDMGIDPVVAAVTMGFMVYMSVPGRLFGGIISDKCSIHLLKWLWVVARSLNALGLFFLIRATTLNMVYVFTVLYGLGLGIGAGSSTPLRARYYGRKGFATISGTISIITLPTGVIAPVYVGWVYDVTGSYIAAFNQALVLLILGIAVTFFLSAPEKKPEIISDPKKFL